jgi:hypothetical protein
MKLGLPHEDEGKSGSVGVFESRVLRRIDRLSAKGVTEDCREFMSYMAFNLYPPTKLLG